MKVALFGKVEFDSYSGELTMLHPEFEILSGDDDDGEASLHVGRIVPIYEAVAKITTRVLRTLIAPRARNRSTRWRITCRAHLRERLKLPDRWTAIRETHFPPPDSDLRLLNAFRSPGAVPPDLRGVLLAGMRRGAEARQGAHPARHRLRDRRPRARAGQGHAALQAHRGAEARLKEIADDMKAPRPMNRLLQGDVGSGKTIVAAEAAVIAIENGYQVAVLAPTEILAAQHAFYFKQILSKLGYVTVLLTGLVHQPREGAAQEAGGRRPGARGDRHARAARKGRASSRSWAWPSSTSSTASA